MTYLIVFVAALSAFMIGGLWYSPIMFLNIWSKASANDPKSEEGRHPVRVFGLSFLFSLIAAISLFNFLGPQPSLQEAIKTSLLIGICFVATSFGINYQFSHKSMILWLIDAGYHCVQFLTMGLIFGLWH
ncbi:MAG: DUF1761 domain-containing protein [Sporocytophaga sp.]|nr:DUF1761 domain-containing protein [Sporocytophaga sp.]